MLELTDLDGKQVIVMKSWIQLIRHQLAREYERKVGCVLVLSGTTQAVRESFSEVWGKLIE